VRAVRLIFTTPFEAGILVTSIRATRDTTGLDELDTPATGGRVASSALMPSVDAALTLERERVDAANIIITSVVSRGAEIEITLIARVSSTARERARALDRG
jgi:hypothetical protein